LPAPTDNKNAIQSPTREQSQRSASEEIQTKAASRPGADAGRTEARDSAEHSASKRQANNKQAKHSSESSSQRQLEDKKQRIQCSQLTCEVHFSGAREVHTASTVVAGAAIAAI
jgi:hypothetical protein